jgi:carboxypeptidase family protein
MFLSFPRYTHAHFAGGSYESGCAGVVRCVAASSLGHCERVGSGDRPDQRYGGRLERRRAARVTLTATQTDTGLKREAVTDEAGSYALLNLPLGPYRLEASLTGFRSFAQSGIVLQVNSNPVIPITLQLGNIQETVSVQGAAPLVETRNPAVGAVINSEQVEALPLEGRNPIALVTLAGAAADTGPPTSRSMTTSRGIAVTGGQPFAVSYLLDGAMHNNVLDGFNLPLPFPDALQEFSVETSSQNAQNGRQGSGTVNVVTKGGDEPVPRRSAKASRCSRVTC